MASISNAGSPDQEWLGGASPDAPTAEAEFGDGGIWIGRHDFDDDLLVFDPEAADAGAANLAFYSLSQLRRRTFPRATALEKIQQVTDAAEVAEASALYERRAELEAEREQDRNDALARSMEQQREGILERHKGFVERAGVTYEGVRDRDPNGKTGRRTKCSACGIALDDFVGAECAACSGVLCSCGACACGGRAKGRKGETGKGDVTT